MSRAVFRFYEELNDFLPPGQRRVELEHRFDRRASVKDMIEALGVPHAEVEMILVDGEPVGFDHIVRDGERVSVYPVFESLDLPGHMRVRPRPLREIRFVLDAQLGTLARYLRLCGFDTLYRNDWDDGELARIAAETGRVLLTRDRDLLKRRLVTRGHFVRSDRPRDQAVEVVRRFDLAGRIEPFARCSHCNGRLDDVDKAAIVERLRPLTRRYYDRFRRCSDCGRIYWHGSHAERIERLLADIRAAAASPPDRSGGARSPSR